MDWNQLKNKAELAGLTIKPDAIKPLTTFSDEYAIALNELNAPKPPKGN